MQPSTQEENHPNWGGKRKGSGAPPKYGEETEIITKRVPKSKKPEISKKFDAILKTYEKKPTQQK